MDNAHLPSLTVKREPKQDQVLASPTPEAKALSVEERDTLLHAYGLRLGKPWKSGWRDYYVASPDDATCQGLVEKGLMVEGRRVFAVTVFRLTDKGKAAAASLIPVYPSHMTGIVGIGA